MRGNLGLLVNPADRARLAAIVADRSSPQKHVWRARVVLLSADQVGTAEIMRRTGLSKPSVWRWQERYIEAGVEGLLRDKTRPSRIPALAQAKVTEVIRRTLEEPPPGEATHWTVRAMAQASSVSPAKVHQIWQAAGLAPHRLRRFKLSTDRAFAAKVEDVVGLYVAPPKHAIVLSLDEKSQIQAQRSAPTTKVGAGSQLRDRTQPGLPMKPGRLGTMTHDYKRHGTTTLFAALNVLDGTVVGRCMQRHRNQEFIRFLNAIERRVPAGKVIHAILDNYAAHKHPNVRKWLARHPRWIFHFTPTSGSWLNAVEGFFAKLTRRRLKRGVFPSLVALQEAINRFIEHHNQEPTPFTWKADPKDIIAAAKRGHQTLQTIH
jgi:transposase